MVADDFNSDIKDFQDLNGEDLDNESSLFSSFRNFNDHLENPLCVPQDPIEDLEWYPNFRDNPISLNWLEFLDTPHQKKTQNCFESEQRQQTKDVILFQNKGYEKDVLFQNHGTEQQKCGILFQNKRIPSKNSEQLEYEDKFVKLSDIQNLPNPLSVQNKEERCFLDYSSSKKKPRRKRVCGSAWLKCAADFENLEGVSKRRCRHCKTEETPLWRNGPLGPKTLCNACGVRYKSGRLLPEYRPAASPTFDAKKHSNFHRRIIKKKGG